MKIKELREALEALARARGADDLRQLARSIAPLDAIDVEDLSKLLAPAVAKRVKAEATKAERVKRAAETARQAAAVLEGTIARYLAELQQTKSDNTAFENVVKRIESDRTIKTAQAEQIAQQFTSNTNKYKTKKAATKAILKRQITDRRTAARSSQVRELF